VLLILLSDGGQSIGVAHTVTSENVEMA